VAIGTSLHLLQKKVKLSMVLNCGVDVKLHSFLALAVDALADFNRGTVSDP
jgi:hypothetical protein